MRANRNGYPGIRVISDKGFPISIHQEHVMKLKSCRCDRSRRDRAEKWYEKVEM